MYQALPLDSARPKPVKCPGWLRLVREPLCLAEREVLAARRGTLQTSADVASLLAPRALAEEVECLYVIALDGKLRSIALEEAARGGRAGASFHARDVLRLAILLGAFAIILVHNHPNGEPAPSAEDIVSTRKVVEAAEVVGIHLVDHVILAGGPRIRSDWFFSFRDHGLLAGR